MIKTELGGLAQFVNESELLIYYQKAVAAAQGLRSGNCRGSSMLGWLRLPEEYDRALLQRIKDTACAIRKCSDAVVVIGIGGSYLGARAGIELIKGANYNALPKGTPDIYFAGNNLSGRQMKDVIRLVGDRNFSVIVISKSGTTTESAIAFRIFRALLEEKYGKAEAAKRIIAITDDNSGALRAMAARERWQSFAIPDNIGGRYSVLTAVGLLPLACAGIDPASVVVGAFKEMSAQFGSLGDSAALHYAAARNALYDKGYTTELLSYWEPEAAMFAEWWKQLFGESEGKEQGGIFPASISCTADLHSMGQYVQQGKRNIMESFLLFERRSSNSFRVPSHGDNSDALAYLEGRTLCEINSVAAEATRCAHVAGGVPCITLRCQTMSDEMFGALCYFFEFACAVSGVMRKINPFDQPGVEEYKRNMFALLGKPGYEELGKNIRKSLE